MKSNRSFPVFTIFLAIFLFTGCDDEKVVHSGSNSLPVDPTILQTDEFGNELGGDTTDWCTHGESLFRFNPAYPNPNYGPTTLRFQIPEHDTLTIYFLRSSIDTVFIMKEQNLNAGVYETTFNGRSLGFGLSVQRIYVKTSNNYNSGPYCRYYGDIQFY
jgi:hypothetical protein